MPGRNLVGFYGKWCHSDIGLIIEEVRLVPLLLPSTPGDFNGWNVLFASVIISVALFHSIEFGLV